MSDFIEFKLWKAGVLLVIIFFYSWWKSWHNR